MLDQIWEHSCPTQIDRMRCWKSAAAGLSSEIPTAHAYTFPKTTGSKPTDKSDKGYHCIVTIPRNMTSFAIEYAGRTLLYSLFAGIGE